MGSPLAAPNFSVRRGWQPLPHKMKSNVEVNMIRDLEWQGVKDASLWICFESIVLEPWNSEVSGIFVQRRGGSIFSPLLLNAVIWVWGTIFRDFLALHWSAFGQSSGCWYWYFKCWEPSVKDLMCRNRGENVIEKWNSNPVILATLTQGLLLGDDWKMRLQRA